MNEANEATTKPYSLRNALRGYGLWNVFRSADLYAAVFAAIALTALLVIQRTESEAASAASSFFVLESTMSAALLGLVLAAFAIVAGLSEARVLAFLKDSQNALSDIIALFWYVGYLAAAATVSGLLGAAIAPRFPTIVPWWLLGASFLALYTLFATVGLIRTVGRLTLAKADIMAALKK